MGKDRSTGIGKIRLLSQACRPRIGPSIGHLERGRNEHNGNFDKNRL